jgi:protein TonB
MKKGKLNTDSWDEIIFEHMNKDYGAYLLRYNYPRYLTISALAVILIFLLFMIGINSSGINKKQTHRIREIKVISYNELSEPPPIEKTYVPQKKVAVKPPEIQKYVAPVVVKEEIEEPEEIPLVEEVKDVPVETTEDANGTESSEGVENGEPVFDVNPEFPGGGGSFKDWLAQNLRYPVAAKRMGIEGTVVVEFMVNEYGEISDITIQESLHRLCDKEAIRLVRIMPPWVPGIKRGITTRGRHSVEIPFIIK